MIKTTEDQNIHTQPSVKHKVFNNWDVVSNGWYIVCKTKDLKINQVESFDICGQRVCVFRDSKSRVYGMDGYCPHMGVDLGIGKVVNDRVRCFFHHWEFNSSGRCEHIPAQKEIPKKACLTKYKVEEKYGYIWINPNFGASNSVLEIPELEGVKVKHAFGKEYFRSCHYHITMINGIDPQHLSTVHNIHMEMNVNIEESEETSINIELQGKIPCNSFLERVVKKTLGDNYSYSMKYADGCVAGLSVMKDILFFGKKGILPTLHMIFAYQLIEKGKIKVTPIFLTKKRTGLLGMFLNWFWLKSTVLAFHGLQGEDGMVYENIRFNTQNLLKIDAPVGKYIQYINKLKPSKWSYKYES
jgi:nitrite reductase/ring-hydroxylating ferredoxin subunit